MEINGMNFTIGADPEIFMSLNGNFVSANDIIPGNKAEPHKVNKGAVQVDGMALEFNIDPANDLDEFMENLEIVQTQLKEMLPQGSDFIKDATVFFDKDFYKRVPQKAKILGCEPDYNAYTMDVNKKPNQKMLLRTAGGHIHIGGFETFYPHDTPHMKLCGRLSRILDETVGIYSVLWDKDTFRRKMYGQAGSFRPKMYGLEYRPLSNAWIFNKNLVSFIYAGVVESLEKFFDPKYEPHPECRHIIDQSIQDHPLLNNRVGNMVRSFI